MTRWMKASVSGQHQKSQSHVLMCMLVRASVSKKARVQWMSVCYRETQGQMELQKAWISRDGGWALMRLPPQGWSFFNTSMANTLVKSTSGAQEALLTISPYTLQVFGHPRRRQFGLWRLFSEMPHHPSPTPHPNILTQNYPVTSFLNLVLKQKPKLIWWLSVICKSKSYQYN